jgi:hypothetical protein
MRSIILNGVEVSIGDEVRFICSNKLYTDQSEVNIPKLGKVYTIREIRENAERKAGFLLYEVKNPEVFGFIETLDGSMISVEVGFGVWRFEPVLRQTKSEKMVRELKITEPETYLV